MWLHVVTDPVHYDVCYLDYQNYLGLILFFPWCLLSFCIMKELHG